MSYLGISVKEAVSHINSENNGWVLPAIQRPYVWGNRHESEKYICKLFDSILRGYPIGGLILWNTEEKIPYREFVSDYEIGDIPRLVDKGLHGRKDKWLVYDGQQRLQTLYSCLKYTFNGKILVYDLLYPLFSNRYPNEIGFSFVEKNSNLPWNYIRINELYSKLSDEKTSFRRNILKNNQNIDDIQEEIVEKNLDQLWKVYVDSDKSSLAYFPIQSSDEDEVNEIFERLNSGGIALSLSDLLFTRIKGHNEQYDFEEVLQLSAKDIYNKTGKGYFFNAYNILQLVNLIIKGRVRIDPKSVNLNELDEFSKIWDALENPLHDFFIDYIWGQFKINKAAIIPKRLALLPIMVYFYEIYKKGFQFKNISKSNLNKINQYFIKSQINDWNLQSYADNFTKIIKEASKLSGSNQFDFPLNDIESKINEKKQRSIDIDEERFVSHTWFSLKILTPTRIYQFEPDTKGRFNPEIDHIFPKKLSGQPVGFDKKVDILWNLQPTKGDINCFKTNHHPKQFFTDKLKNRKGDTITGSKYVNDYDFLFPKNNVDQIDFNDSIWDNPIDFIEERKKQMISYMKSQYGIIIR